LISAVRFLAVPSFLWLRSLDMQIAFITEEAVIVRSFDLMSKLRPHLTREAYVAMAQHLAANMGYRLVGVEDDGLRALAGIRIGEWLHTGRYLEIEELITAEADRSRGYGRALLAWIVDYARSEGCTQVRLLSGLQRQDAHRFYEREGLVWQAKYFALDID
jgi:GNAT superfamily N-acetyltransferase